MSRLEEDLLPPPHPHPRPAFLSDFFSFSSCQLFMFGKKEPKAVLVYVCLQDCSPACNGLRMRLCMAGW